MTFIVQTSHNLGTIKFLLNEKRKTNYHISLLQVTKYLYQKLLKGPFGSQEDNVKQKNSKNKNILKNYFVSKRKTEFEKEWSNKDRRKVFLLQVKIKFISAEFVKNAHQNNHRNISNSQKNGINLVQSREKPKTKNILQMFWLKLMKKGRKWLDNLNIHDFFIC